VRTHKAAFALLAAALAAGLAAHPGLAAPSTPMHEFTVAQADGDPLPTPPPDPNTLTNPNDDKHTVTRTDVEECMKSWDPQTGMSKEEYRKSCESTLKYYPEKGN